MDVYIDIGSTNVKWVYSNGKVNKIPFPAPVINQNGIFEVDPELIYQIVEKLVNGANRAFLSVQMHGYVLLQNGKAVTNYISWRDERASGITPNFELIKEYGVDIKPNLPRLSLQTQTVEFNCFCTLGSYLTYRLTGNNKTHISDGAPSGFFNVKQKSAVKTNFELPKVSYSVEVVGEYNGTKIYTPIGDQQSAILGAVGQNYNGLILNLGTAGQMCCIENGFISGDFESRPYFNGNTLCTVTRLIGGGVIASESDQQILPKLIKDYSLALKKLPQKPIITVTGGVVNYRKPLLEKVLLALGVNYTFNAECDALKGLEIIAKGENL